MSEETTYIHAVTETYGREHHTEGQDKTLEEELLVEIHKESEHGEDNEAVKYFLCRWIHVERVSGDKK